MDTIESIKLNNVEVQANGIIRNEKGYLIGRLVGGVEYDGEHVKKLGVSSETMVPGTFTHVTPPTQPDWISEFRLKFRALYGTTYINKENSKHPTFLRSTVKELEDFIQKVGDTSKAEGYSQGIAGVTASDLSKYKEGYRIGYEEGRKEGYEIKLNDERWNEFKKEAVDTFRTRVIDELERISQERGNESPYIRNVVEEAKEKVRNL